GRDSSDKNLDEVINEIMIDRGMQPQSKGVVHWSISSLTRNPRLMDTLMKSVYKKQALIPASPWLSKKIPVAPVVTTIWDNDILKISWTHPDDATVFHWVVYYQYGNRWDYKILNPSSHSFALNKMNAAANQQSLRKIIV